MKTLSLLRHAEAEQPLGVRDFDRGLSSYGAQMAPRLGRRLEQKNFMPDLIVTSPAARTIATAQIISYELGYPVESMVFRDEIYQASLTSLLQVVRSFEENLNHVLLIGHNPALSQLASYLCQSPHEQRAPSHMATCALFRVALGIEYWALVEQGCGQFNEYDTPENVT